MATGSIKGKRPASSGTKPGASKSFSFKNLGANAKTAKAGEVGYTGDLPPEGAYVVILKRLSVEEWKSSPGLNMLFEIAEPKGSPREKYNGYGSWGGQGITDQGAGYINQFLTAAFSNEPEIIDYFWDDGVRTKAIGGKNGRTTNIVTAIGEMPVQRVKTNGDKVTVEMVEEFKLVITVKHETYNGKKSARPQGYVPLSESQLNSDSDEGEETPDDAFEDDGNEGNEDEPYEGDSDDNSDDGEGDEGDESEPDDNSDEFFDENN